MTGINEKSRLILEALNALIQRESARRLARRGEVRRKSQRLGAGGEYRVVLVDTSIWINHFRSGNDRLAKLLDEQEVLGHPFVIGEIALGESSNMPTVLKDLLSLPAAAVATDEEVLHFIADKSLAGRRIGLIDVHLLAATFLTLGSKLWTLDRKLFAVAARMKIALDP